MKILFVVSRPEDWPFEIPGITAIAARNYLIDPAFGESASTRVFNLCSNYRYQSHGYYVSLLAEARGHQPLPGVEALKDLQSSELLQNVRDRLGDLASCTFAPLEQDQVELRIYFGQHAGGDRRNEHLCMELFRTLSAPILHARFKRTAGFWRLMTIRAGEPGEIPEAERSVFCQSVLAYMQQQRIRSTRPAGEAPLIAILHDPQREEAPSNPQALHKFCEAATMLGMKPSLITRRDAGRLAEFDALFIRDTTNVNHYTYHLSRLAAAAGLVVIDDPDAILRCTNKIYLAELMTRHHIPIPKTLVVHPDNIDRIIPTLGLPCILKQPDGAFSLGVAKVHTEEELMAKVRELLRHSELVLAQQYLPTEFDWRIAVLDNRPLFVCKYYMAPGHWQIIRHDSAQTSEGKTEALSIGEVPNEVIDIAVRAAGLIGDGFYGVDLKEVDGQCYIIEINDNPNVDAGNEDGVLGDALYREVMGVFNKRIEALRGLKS
jgi:glutathione synthase/RimK-type ligase-like ATP-grasp enzyme